MTEPAITTMGPALHMSGPNEPIQRVVIHTTSPGQPGTSSSASGMAHATAKYFQSPKAGGLAHYITDVGAEEHCCPDHTACWHAPPNQHSIGIEICAEPTYTRAEWLSDQVWPAVLRAQQRALEVCHRFGVPWVRIGVDELRAGHHGVCGHVDVSGAWHQTDHTDPGPNFPWAEFMAAPAPPSGVKPMYDPPLPPTCASRKAPGGGVWLLSPQGAVGAIEGAPFAGAPFGKPYFAGHTAARFATDDEMTPAEKAAGKLYVVLDTAGNHYAYPE